MFEQLLTITAKVGPVPIQQRNWSAVSAFGGTSLQASGVMYNGKAYLFGGRVGLSATGRYTAFVFDGTNYSGIASLPVPLILATSVLVDDKIYILGGCYSLSNGQENRDMYVYDPALNTYTTVGTMPFSSLSGGSCRVGDYIYVYGGLVNQSEAGTHPKQFYRYNLTTKTWESLPYHDGLSLYAVQIFEYNGKIYTFSGEQNSGGVRDSAMRMFDPDTLTWTTIAPPTPVPSGRGIIGFKYGDGFVIMGGRLTNNSPTSEVWYYKVDQNQWIKCRDFIAPVAFQVVLCDGERVFSFDGFSGSSAYSGIYKLT
ncbi:hypothetical protein [Pseudomonas phage D6]|nr:hypothetical protein [Pseudomonas phage D6]